MAGINRLSKTQIKTLTTKGRHADGGGLFLRVSGTGAKSWSFRWKRTEGTGTARKPVVREYGLGSHAAVSLEDARAKAKLCRAAVAKGQHPKDALRPPDRKTFYEAAREFMDYAHVHEQHKDNVAQWCHLIDDRLSRWSSRDVATIGQADVLEVLEPIWFATPEAARRARRRIDAVLSFAIARKWRDGPNPATWKGNLQWHLKKHKNRTVANHPAMPYDDVPGFVTELQNRSGMGALALEFLILTAARTGEVLRAGHDEFDLSERTWTRPAAHMKQRDEPHAVPLTDRAIEIVAPLLETPIGPYVFAGAKRGKPLSGSTLQAVMDRMGIDRADAVPHGFRSSFRDFIREQTSFHRELAELSLAHAVGSKSERTYARGTALERRRPLMDAWTNHIEGREGATVVSFRSA